MSRWTDSLIEPLARILSGGPWLRIEESRRGGWLLLSGEGGTDGIAWYHLADVTESPSRIDPLDDKRLPQLNKSVRSWLGSGFSCQLLAWRVGSRAVFRLETPTGPTIAKIYRKDRDLMKRWSAASENQRWGTPEITSWDPEAKVLLTPFCDGTSLNQSWLSGDGELVDGEKVASVLDWLASTPIPEEFPQHQAEDEIRILLERLPVFERTLQNPPERARDLCERVVESLRDSSKEGTVLVHRDFHDKQLIIDGDGGTLIDLDLAAAGPPALDPGNIIAHLRLRSLKGAKLPWHEIALEISRGLSTDRVDRGELRIWTAATLMRLSLIYARRRREPGLIDALLDSTEEALEGTGQWKEILS